MEIRDDISMSERERRELSYFSSSLWKDVGLDETRIGIECLRRFLQDLLSRHTERELPKVREEIRNLLRSTQKEIERLGEERPTTSHLRMFLSRIAMRFHNVTNAALIGDYDSSEQDFFRLTLSQQRRLRASVHSINTDFSNDMRTHGATVRIVSETDDEDSDRVDLETVALDQDSTSQVSVTEAKFKEWVRQVNIIRAPIPQPLRTNS